MQSTAALSRRMAHLSSSDARRVNKTAIDRGIMLSDNCNCETWEFPMLDQEVHSLSDSGLESQGI